MKKNISIILIIFIIILSIIFAKFVNFNQHASEVKQFNLYYENYKRDNLNGLDIVTLINKAMNENKNNEVTKDENGYYNLEDNKSIVIYVNLTNPNVNKEKGKEKEIKIFRMEKIVSVGTDSFVKLFGNVKFKCTDIKKHEDTGRIASMTFEVTKY